MQLVSEIIQKTIGGEFKKDGQKFSFNKYFTGRALQIEITNTAFGIKSFGILQLLNNNGFLDKKYVLILDEPTSFLDKENEMLVFDTLKHICDTYQKTIIISSHSDYAMSIADKIYEIQDKEIVKNFF